MKAQDALEEFRKFINQTAISLECLSPGDAVKLMLMFYGEVRAEGCSVEDNRDMLLFQWGMYDWGSGEYFEYEIARQFIFPVRFQDGDDDWEDDSIWQLRLTLKYKPAPALRVVKPGSRWCETPGGTADFLQFIHDCEATEVVRSRAIEAIDLTNGDVE